MNLSQHLHHLEDQARAALAVVDGDPTDPQLARFRDGDSPELDALGFLLGGYAFTPAPDSPVIAVLSVGAPDAHMTRTDDGYALTAYAPGHADALLTSETITRWGRMIDAEADR